MKDISAKRNYAFDVMRVIALSAVIMIHVSSRLFDGFEFSSFFVGNIFNSVSRFAVPVFAMVTGALLLNEEKKLSFKAVLSGYILKTAALFLFWSFLYAMLFFVAVPIKNGEAVAVSDVLVRAFKGHYHMWYLQMLLAFYCVLPLIRHFTEKQSKKAAQILICSLVLIQSLLPLIDLLLSEKKLMPFYEKSGLRIFFGFHLFFLAGWYFNTFRLSQKQRSFLYTAGALSLAFTVIVSAVVAFDRQTAYTEIYNSLYLNNVIFSFAVFEFFRHRFGNADKVPEYITGISSLSFGIYIVHPIVLELFCEKGFMPSSPLLYVITLWLITAVLSYLICFVISKIPFIKKIIRT